MREIIQLYNNVQLWEEPAKEIWEGNDFVCEMNKGQHAFISGLIRKYRPAKLVELGVAEGGTTAVIMNTLCKLEMDSEFISVDLNERLYCDKQYETGYVYKEVAKKRGWERHKHCFLFGEAIAGQIEKIGGNIEMIILDTTHCMPGEVMDFLCVLPYLAQGAVVVLHDVDLNYHCAVSKTKERVGKTRKSIASRVLFSTVAAEKFLYNDDFLPSNISAFRISDDTYKYISNVVSALNLVWEYNLTEEMFEKYRALIKKNYPVSIIKELEEAARRNKEMRQNLGKVDIENQWRFQFPFDKIPYGSKLVIYGAGEAGKTIYSILEAINYCEVVLWVDSEYQKKQEEKLPISAPEDIKEYIYDGILVAVEDRYVFEEIKKHIDKLAITQKNKIIWGPVKRR